MNVSTNNADRIAHHLKEAAVLRRIAHVLTLRQARATVLQAAIAHEQAAESLRAAEAVV
jgi:hypothetical protein